MKLGPCLAAILALATARADETAVKPLTLDDCIKMALEKNLDIRISRVTPKVAALELGASYTDYYDPQFNLSVGQSDYISPGQGFANTFSTPPNETWTEQYRTSLSGYLPSGLNYSFQGSVTRNSGISYLTGVNSNGVPFSTQVNDGFLYTPSASVNLDQPLLRNFWIDNYRYTIEINKRTLKGNEQDLRNQAITTITAVANAYFDLTAAREMIGVQEKALQLAEQQLAENRKRVEVGALAPLDEKQAQSQVQSTMADLITSRNTFQVAQTALKELITDDFASLATVTLEPQGKLEATPTAFSAHDSWQKGLTMRPDVIQAKLNLEKQNITARFKRNQVFPQLDLTGSYGVTARRTTVGDAINDLDNRSYPNFSIGVLFSTPLDNKSARNRLKEAKLQAEQALLQFQKLEQTVMGDIMNAIGNAQSALQKVTATAAARDYALLAFEAEKKKLENGKSTSFIVLQLQSTYTTAAGSAIQAVADYNKALDTLYQSEGSALDRRGIRFSLR